MRSSSVLFERTPSVKGESQDCAVECGSSIPWPHAIDTEKSFDGEPSWILSRSGKAEPARLAGVAKPEPPGFALWAPIAQENGHAADRIAAYPVRTHVAKFRPLARGPARVASTGSGTCRAGANVRGGAPRHRRHVGGTLGGNP